MFNSIYKEQLSQYYNLRRETLSESATKHELCYLLRFDSYVSERLDLPGFITENFINEWVGSLSGKSSSIENEIIVIRKFLEFIKYSGENVTLPSVPKVHDDYVPYIFSDTELNGIFELADNIVQRAYNADPYLVIEFPVILRLLYSC
jgi:site-specific recombinase XerD